MDGTGSETDRGIGEVPSTKEHSKAPPGKTREGGQHEGTTALSIEAVAVNNHLTEHEDVSAMEKLRKPLGTNPGGVFLDHKTGEHLYVKQYRDPAQASCEFIANRVLSRIGAPVLEGALVSDGEKVAYATPYHSEFTNLPEEKRARAQDYFVAAAYLMDADMVGIGPENPFGNLQEDEKGNLVLVDHGAALLFHGLMGRKDKSMLVTHDMAELRDMRNHEINPKSAQIFDGISQEEIGKQAGEIVDSITPDFIEAVVAESKLSEKDADQVRALLLGRRKILERMARRNHPKTSLPSKEIIAANLVVPGFSRTLTEDHPEAQAIIDEITAEQKAQKARDRASEPIPSKEIIAANLVVPGFSRTLTEDHPEAQAIIDEITAEQQAARGRSDEPTPSRNTNAAKPHFASKLMRRLIDSVNNW